MPNLDNNLAFAPAHELADMIADKRISSVELTELYLSRMERLDGQLNSYLTPTPEIALEQARKVDEATAQGREPGRASRIADFDKGPADDGGGSHDGRLSRVQGQGAGR